MTVAVRATSGRHARPGTTRRPVARATLIGGLLAVAVWARWAVTTGGNVEALAVGLAFGAVLVGIASVGGWRPRARPGLPQLVVGAAGGLVLVGLALATRWPGPWISLQPAASFWPWAAVTLLVAVGEEAVLRGALLAAVDEAMGVGPAIAVTAAVFALLHVPLYGWHVVPLDLGVGLLLGGLRVLGGGIVAPAVAHVVADLATWWM